VIRIPIQLMSPIAGHQARIGLKSSPRAKYARGNLRDLSGKIGQATSPILTAQHGDHTHIEHGSKSPVRVG